MKCESKELINTEGAGKKMKIFAEWEGRMGGRIKSVLIVALSALLLWVYAKAGESEGFRVREVSSGQAVGEPGDGNPVDRFFLGGEDLSGSERDRWQQLYLDAWERELTHAYELMGEELPESFLAEGGGLRAGAAFGEFLEAQSSLEGYYAQGVGRESGAVTDVRLELTRAQAQRLYGLIGEKKGDGAGAELYLFPESSRP